MRTVFPIILELPEDDYDGLTFSTVRPHFSEHRYNADGTRTTKLQHKQLGDCESTDMAEASESSNSAIEAPFPEAKITEIMEDVQPTEAPALADNEDPPAADMQRTSAFESFTLKLPDISTSLQGAALRLDTSVGPIPSTSTSNAASMPTSALALAISSTSSADFPQPARQRETERSRNQRRRQ